MSYSERLANMNDAWGKAQVDSRGLPPDGDYQALVDRFDFIDSSYGLLLKTELRITGGDWDGMHVDTVHNLEQAERLEWTKKHLASLGCLPERLSDLEAALPRALDNVVEVTVKTSEKKDAEGNPYRNLYVNKVLRLAHDSDITPVSALPVDADGPEVVQSDENIPF